MSEHHDVIHFVSRSGSSPHRTIDHDTGVFRVMIDRSSARRSGGHLR